MRINGLIIIGVFILNAGFGLASEEPYDTEVILIKFTSDISANIDVVNAVVVTGIDGIDALNEKYGVYDYELPFPLPASPVEHPNGLWDWDDYTTGYDEFGLGLIYAFKFPADFANVAGAATAYAQEPEVDYVSLNYHGVLTAKPNDPDYNRQWHFYNIKAEKAWDISKGNDVVIAVIDTGCDDDHTDLDGKIVAGYDFVDMDNDPSDESTNSHGTHVGGIAAAETNNGVGIAGLGWNSKIMPLRVCRGYAQYEELNVRFLRVAKGVKWAVENGADVINISLGFNKPDMKGNRDPFRDVCGFGYRLNIILVASAGNDNAEILWPARYASVIAVAAT